MTGVVMVIFPGASGGGGGGGGMPIIASASPSSLTWVSAGPLYISSGDCTVFATGGSGDYSYLWVSDNASALNQGAATTSFSSGSNISAVVSCIVTDNITGASGTSNNVSVNP